MDEQRKNILKLHLLNSHIKRNIDKSPYRNISEYIQHLNSILTILNPMEEENLQPGKHHPAYD